MFPLGSIWLFSCGKEREVVNVDLLVISRRWSQGKTEIRDLGMQLSLSCWLGTVLM